MLDHTLRGPSDEMDGRLRAAHLAELAEIPDRDRDGLVELGRRDLGRVNPLLERQQTLSNLRGNVAVVHHIFRSSVSSLLEQQP